MNYDGCGRRDVLPAFWRIAGSAFSGCPFEQKRRFIVDLMADLTQEMNAANVSAQALWVFPFPVRFKY